MNYFTSNHLNAIKQVKKQFNCDNNIKSGNYTEKISRENYISREKIFQKNVESLNENKVKEIISRYKTFETFKSWHPEAFYWLKENNKLDMISHLHRRMKFIKGKPVDDKYNYYIDKQNCWQFEKRKDFI